MDRRSWRAALIAASVGCRGAWPWWDLLPEGIQQQVREGQLSAHLAMKFLVPVARVSLDDCQRMAAGVRSASLQYAASRATVCRLARRLAPDPPASSRPTRVVFQNPAARRTADSPRRGPPALQRDLDMATAILNRARRRLAGAGAAEMDRPQRQAVRGQIEHLRQQLNRLAERIPEEEEPDVEPIPTDHHSGTEPAGSEQAPDRAGAGPLPSLGPPRFCVRIPPRRRNSTAPRKPNPTGSRSWSCSPVARGIWCESMKSSSPAEPSSLTRP